jgi:hypothetical protein
MLTFHLRLDLSSCLFASGFKIEIYTLQQYLSCHTQLILLDSVTLLIFVKEYKLCHFSLFNFFHLPIPTSLFDQNILLSTLSLNTINTVALY